MNTRHMEFYKRIREIPYNLRDLLNGIPQQMADAWTQSGQEAVPTGAGNSGNPDDPAQPTFDKAVLDAFRENVGRHRAETGGILACSGDLRVIDVYRYDEVGSQHGATSTSYSYDVPTLSLQVHEWRQQGIQPVGFIHSHPHNYRHPSYSDLANASYLMEFFRNREFFYMPIMINDKAGCYRLYMFVARRTDDGESLQTTLDYVLQARPDGSYEQVPFRPWCETHRIQELRAHFDRECAAMEEPAPQPAATTAEYYARLNGVFPDKVLDKLIICIGVGGARMYLEQMARNGYRYFVLMDGDRITPPNIATQGVYVPEMGMYKAEACRAAIQAINPEAHVLCINRFLDDTFTDREFEQILSSYGFGTADGCGRAATDALLLGCCDSFGGNSRAAALAMQYGIPFITCGMYAQGLAGELAFTYPGVTPSCPRCMLRKRYEAYESGALRRTPSDGSPSFHTERFNSILGEISLMLLMYHEAPGSPYNEMLDQVKDRNFVWVRMSPFLSQTLGIDLFDRVLGRDAATSRYTFYDETLWIPQHPDSPENGEVRCRMCGGKGDLRELRGLWQDTRRIFEAS